MRNGDGRRQREAYSALERAVGAMARDKYDATEVLLEKVRDNDVRGLYSKILPYLERWIVASKRGLEREAELALEGLKNELGPHPLTQMLNEMRSGGSVDG